MAKNEENGARRVRRGPSGRTLRVAGLALLAGVALNLAFAPIGWWFVAPLAVAALSALVQDRKGSTGAFIGFAFGTGFCWVMFQWLRVFGPGAQEAVGLLESLYFIPMGWGMARVSRTRLAPLWQACLWVGEEFLRDRVPFGGFSWGRLAFSQPHSLYTPIASLGGAPLLTFAVALSGTLLWRGILIALRSRRAATATAAATATGGADLQAVAATAEGAENAADSNTDASDASPAAATSAATSPAAAPPQTPPSQTPPRSTAPLRAAALLATAAVAIPVAALAIPLTSPSSGTPMRIALIQGNVPRTGLNYLDQQAAVLNDHVKETEAFAEQVREGKAVKPDFVVWPENGSDIDPYTDAYAHAEITQAVQAVGVPVLVGAVIDAPDGTNVLNRLIVWDPKSGMGQTYDKNHLVPFGEYLPFRALLTKFIKRFDQIPRDFLPGHSRGTLDIAGTKVAAVMCFEVAYDDVVRSAVTGGGGVLLVPSNNASYMHTGQTYQQLAIAQVRAVEHGRWTMEVATSGVSAVVDPTGKVLTKTGEYQAAAIDAEVRTDYGTTLADRLGAAPEWVMALLGLAAAAACGPRARRLARTLARKGEPGAGTLPGAASDENETDTTVAEREPPLEPAVKGRAR